MLSEGPKRHHHRITRSVIYTNDAFGRDRTMSAFSPANLLWYYALFFGWSSMIAIALATYARNRFRACLKERYNPSTSSGDTWEEMFMFWNMSGLAMAGVAVLCCGLWLVV